jgi:hypothetical protein
MNDIIYILNYFNIKKYYHITKNWYGNELIGFRYKDFLTGYCLWYPYLWDNNVLPNLVDGIKHDFKKYDMYHK